MTSTINTREGELIKLIKVLHNNGTLNARNLNVKSPDASNLINQNWDLLFSLIVNDNLYNNAKAKLNILQSNMQILTNKESRITVTMPDGTVYYDSIKSNNNSFINATEKTINENHNTRAAIMNAQSLQSGYAFESKYSTTSMTIEDYVALRIGPQGLNYGTVRYSFTHNQIIIAPPPIDYPPNT